MTVNLFALLLCDAATKGPDGKTTIYGIFDVIQTKESELPIRHHQFSVYWKIYTEKPGEISLRIEKPDGSPLIMAEPIKVEESAAGRYEGFHTFGNLEFPVTGDYNVLLILNGTQELGRQVLTIKATGN